MDHVYTLTETVRMNLSNPNSSVVACFVDFQKAFPSVNRDLLLYKLHCAGVNGRILKALAAGYSDPQYVVRVNGELTPAFPSVLGLPEGDPNSPLSFSTYLNDLLVELQESKLGLYYGNGENDILSVLAYADDLVLLSNCPDKLQKMLDILQNYCAKWRLSVNVGKTKTMSFRKSTRSKRTEVNVKFDGQMIEQVSDYKYLGVVVDEVLGFKLHMERVAHSGSRALGAVIGKTRDLKDLGLYSYDKLVTSCVFSILDYGAEVTGFVKSKQAEDV